MKKIFGIFLVINLLFCTFYVPRVDAKTLGDLKKELAEYEKQEQENKEQKELSEQEKINIQSKITDINENIVNIGNEIIELNKEVDKLNEDIALMEDEIDAILSFTQVSNGESAYLEYAFGAQDFTDFIYRIAVSEQLTGYNDSLINKYQGNIEANKQKEEKLKEKRIQLNSEQDKLHVELEKIDDYIQEINKLDKSVDEKMEDLKSRIKVYEEKGCKDNEDINTCGKAILPKDTRFWRPMAYGALTGYYGPNSCYYSNGKKICRTHNGLDMSGGVANYNDVPAYAAANGVVVSVTDIYDRNGNIVYKCGGRRVYIEHNVNGTVYTTAYLHLRRLNVKEGDVVNKDTVIGIIGGNPDREWWDTCSTGAHLHFEISYGKVGVDYEARRVDPLTIVNFPSGLYVDWNDRITKF